MEDECSQRQLNSLDAPLESPDATPRLNFAINPHLPDDAEDFQEDQGDRNPEFVKFFENPENLRRSFTFNSRYMTEDRVMYPLLCSMMEELMGRNDYFKRQNGCLFHNVEINGRNVWAIKSAMGTGKTTFLKAYLENVIAFEAWKQPTTPLHIVVVVSRISLADTYATLLRDIGFINYRESDTPTIDAMRVICTPESYARLQEQSSSGISGFKDVDILILDELETLLNSVMSKTMDQRRGLFFALFAEYFKETTTQVIAMDACLTFASMELLLTMCGLDPDEDDIRIPKVVFTIYNTCRPALPNQITVTRSLSVFENHIFRAIDHCIREEWEHQETLIQSGELLMADMRPEFQIVIAHGSLKKLNGLHMKLCQQYPDYCSDRTCARVNSATGENKSIDEWVNFRIIQHTSSIAAGCDYNPAKRGRNVFVFSWTLCQITPDLMCQMTFRTRLPIARQVTFYVPIQINGRAVQIEDRQQLIDSYNLAGTFLRVKELRSDLTTFRLTKVSNELGRSVRVPMLNIESLAVLIHLHQRVKQNQAENNYMKRLVIVLSDMSDDFLTTLRTTDFDIDLPGSVDDETLLVESKRDRKLKAENIELSHQHIDNVIEKAIERIIEFVGDGGVAEVSDLIKRFDQSNRSISHKSTEVDVFVYRTAMILQSIGLKRIPGAGNNHVDDFHSFYHSHHQWFSENWEFYQLLLDGTNKVDLQSEGSWYAGKDTRNILACRNFRVYLTLETVRVLIPSAIIEKDDHLSLKPMFSNAPRAGKTSYPANLFPNAVKLHSMEFRNYDGLLIHQFAHKRPELFTNIFKDVKGVKAMGDRYIPPGEGRLDRFSCQTMADNVKTILSHAGFRLSQGKKRYLPTPRDAPPGAPRPNTVEYDLLPVARDIHIVTKIRQLRDDIIAYRDTRVVSTEWIQVRSSIDDWKYLSMFESLF